MTHRFSIYATNCIEAGLGPSQSQAGPAVHLGKRRWLNRLGRAKEDFCFPTLTNRIQPASSTPDRAASILSTSPWGLGGGRWVRFTQAWHILCPARDVDGPEREHQMDLATWIKGRSVFTTGTAWNPGQPRCAFPLVEVNLVCSFNTVHALPQRVTCIQQYINMSLCPPFFFPSLSIHSLASLANFIFVFSKLDRFAYDVRVLPFKHIGRLTCSCWRESAWTEQCWTIKLGMSTPLSPVLHLSDLTGTLLEQTGLKLDMSDAVELQINAFDYKSKRSDWINFGQSETLLQPIRVIRLPLSVTGRVLFTFQLIIPITLNHFDITDGWISWGWMGW